MHSRQDSWSRDSYEARGPGGGRGHLEGGSFGGERRGGHRPNPPRREFGKDRYTKDKVVSASPTWTRMHS